MPAKAAKVSLSDAAGFHVATVEGTAAVFGFAATCPSGGPVRERCHQITMTSNQTITAGHQRRHRAGGRVVDLGFRMAAMNWAEV